ncbi:MAG TPA: chromate transporter [Rubrivivax sp.]|nr:chromate transporter [Rubrivivax sp.]
MTMSWVNPWLFGPGALAPGDWLGLFTHFAMLSLLAVGGAITTVPDMHRVVVVQHGWLSDAEFTGSVALAQAAPGPNVLFVAVIGFNIGGLAGVLVTMLGTLLPSTTLALYATRLGERHRKARSVRAFTSGLAPLTIGLLIASGWVLLEPLRSTVDSTRLWAGWLLVAATVTLMWRTKLSPLWPIAAGALAGGAGVV